MRARVRILGLAVLALTVPVLAHADPAPRKGFWWSFGLGYGSARAQCVECTSEDREGSVAGSFRLGGTIGDNLLIGWELGGWLKNSSGWLPTDQDVSRTLGNSSIVALYYPRAASGLFVKVGAGLSYVNFPRQDQDVRLCLHAGCVPVLNEGVHANGFGMTAGLGYDIQVGTNVSLTPELAFSLGRLGDLDEETSPRQGPVKNRPLVDRRLAGGSAFTELEIRFVPIVRAAPELDVGYGALATAGVGHDVMELRPAALICSGGRCGQRTRTGLGPGSIRHA
jgi:hypothetical protein